MSFEPRILETHTEVAASVYAGESGHDLSLSLGCAMLTDPESFILVQPYIPHEPARVQVVGVTALTIDKDRKNTFRSATFAIEDPTSIAAVDAIGANAIIQSGTVTDIMPRMRAMLERMDIAGALYNRFNTGGLCLLGGAVTYLTPNNGNRTSTQLFAPVELLDVMDTIPGARAIKLGSRIASSFMPKTREANKIASQSGVDPRVQNLSGMFSIIAANATRSSEPPAVVRHAFAANL